MGITVEQIVYAAVFLAILFGVEAVYLFIRGNDARERAVNRRMQAVQKSDSVVINPSLMRNEVIGGPISQLFTAIFPPLRDMFWAANVRLTPAQGALLVVGLFALIFFVLRFILVTPVWLAMAVALVVGVGVPFLALNIKADQERKKFSAQLPDAINLISRGLQAGHPVPVAFELVAKEMPDPIGGQFGIVIDEVNFGRDRDAALRDVARKFPDPDFKFFLAAAEMQRETGGNLVGILDNLTRIIRERSNMRKKAWAVSAEGRLTCLIVGSLPYILMGFLLTSNPDFILGVVDDPMFWPLMGGAWFLWLIGIIWIWRMVNIKV